MHNSWFKFLAAGDTTAVNIFGEIGGEVTLKDFANELHAIQTPTIDLYVNSYGGDLFAGVAIYNLLRSHKSRIVSHVLGVAASAASLIAIGADEVRIADGAFLMIHLPSSLTIGTESDMTSSAELLAKLGAEMAKIYAAEAGGTPAFWLEQMQAETWYTSAEAVESGLADAIESSDEGAALAPTAAAQLVTQSKHAPSAIRRIAALAKPRTNGDSPMPTKNEKLAEAEAVARREWETVPAVRAGFASADRYVQFRARVLTGEIRVGGPNPLPPTPQDHPAATPPARSALEPLSFEGAPDPKKAPARPQTTNREAIAAWAQECAEWEWTYAPSCRAGWSAQARYVAMRGAELRGDSKVCTGPQPIPGHLQHRPAGAAELRLLAQGMDVPATEVAVALAKGMSANDARCYFKNWRFAKRRALI